MNINKFIESEKNYFQPMLNREKKVSEEQKLIWRTETVQQRSERVSLEVFDMLNGSVSYGPFKGLTLQKSTWWGKNDLGSMLLGLYEKEILDYIGSLKVGDFSSFIDVGAADGYYACGLLFSGKIKNAICFESSELGRSVIESNWQNNGGKGNLKIFGEANLESINQLSKEDLDKGLVLIDIEGFEYELLTDEVLYKLNKCTVIIEIHNWVEGFIDKYENFLIRASKCFSLGILPRVERPTLEIPELRDFTDDNRLLLVSERRPCVMRFLKLTPF